MCESMQQRLHRSCLVHSLKHMNESMAEKLCACMAREFIDNELVTDEMRERLAEDWNGGINLEGRDNVGGEEGNMMGVGMIVWGICMEKVEPDYFRALTEEGDR